MLDSLSRRSIITYLLLVGLPLLGLLFVLEAGQALAPAGMVVLVTSDAHYGAPLDVPLLLAQIVVIIAVSRLAGRALAALGQPRVVGEMAAGILLGPSVLGVLAPQVFSALFHVGSVRFLDALAQVGLLLFMFVVGLQVDPRHLKERAPTIILTSHASIAMPLFLGGALSLLLFPRLAPSGVTFTSFALFVAAAMSITAFPVLARILTERGLTTTRLGAIAIACAAVDDVTAWCILAGVVVLVREARTGVPLWVTLGGTFLYVALMLTAGRGILRRLAERCAAKGQLSQDVLGAVMIAVLASAWITERLGIHALFGAFLVGAIMPRTGGLVSGLLARIEDVMVVLLLPLFFAYTGLRTRIGLIGGADMWLLCGLVTVVAIAGKLGGTSLAARASGIGWRESAALGALMNTRGLMELVILNVGYDLGVISTPLFAMMVLMAMATTLMTTPLVSWLNPLEAAAAATVRT
jgi:Kef-type K+ transport system membrane component KefB